MSNAIIGSNVTSGFIDLATFDELEKYMYGSSDATAYFVRQTRRSTWFTQVPVVLSKASGQADFGNDWSVSISRAGDYLLHTWLRVEIPAVKAKDGFHIRWCQNLMHNLVREATITFNDLIAARFDSYHLDFWSAFTVPAGKRCGYKNMIGDFDDLNNPGSNTSLSATTLNLPLPFFFTRDSGVALPTAALPYNEMRMNFQFRSLEELLIVTDDLKAGDSTKDARVPLNTSDHLDGSAIPRISKSQVWANYAIVSNEERKRMACAPRNILIEQVQTINVSSYDPSGRTSFDLRFAHAIKVLFFAVRNSTHKSEWSNYKVYSPLVDGQGNVDFDNDAVDPIKETSLVYENTNRLAQMGSDYFSLVNPYYHAPFIPQETGYHMYSYSLDFCALDPMGSTNYGKLTNVSIYAEPSQDCKDASAGKSQSGSAIPEQSYVFLVTAVNNNVIRISGGALGFPVL